MVLEYRFDFIFIGYKIRKKMKIGLTKSIFETF